MKPKINIENITYLIDFKQSLDFDERKAEIEGFEELSNLSGFVISLENSSAKSIVFPSAGKAFLLGVKSEAEMERIFWILINELKKVSKLKLNPEIEIETHNIFASTNLRENSKGEIDLEKIAMMENSVYEPKKFPGVFLRIFSSNKEKKILGTAIVFRSGKTLLGDVKSISDASLLLDKLLEMIR